MKTKVAILFGGKSPEHHISLLSSKNVIGNIDYEEYEVHLVGIDKLGNWFYFGQEIAFANDDGSINISLPKGGKPTLLNYNPSAKGLVEQNSGDLITQVDVIFPVLHGAFGEDGAVQGLAKLAAIPMVGCGVLGSAMCMDKDITKKILKEASISVAPGVTARKGIQYDYERIAVEFGQTLFIKPVNLGSSVGVSKVENKEEFDVALKLAFEYDSKVLIEQKIDGQEIECAVLGNDMYLSSVIGEVLPVSNFYSFDTKYVDSDGSETRIPAKISDEAADKAREIAIHSFMALECKGLARVDMFLMADGGIMVNEINTMPGFTEISMYPQLMGKSGIPYTTLISKLIKLAIAQFEDEQALKTT